MEACLKVVKELDIADMSELQLDFLDRLGLMSIQNHEEYKVDI